MTSLKDIRETADAAFNHISVNDELREETMKTLHRRQKTWPGRVLIPAVCTGAIIIAVVSAAGLPGFSGKQVPGADKGGTGINTMAAETGTKGQDSTFDQGVQVLKTWTVDSMEEAGKYMGGAVLIPSFIPEGCQLKEILAAGPKTGDAITVMMEFERDGRSFSIQQGRVEKQMDLKGGKKVDINGVDGYINSFKSGDANNPIYSTDLKWYMGDMLYMVQGAVSEEDALYFARSLK